jgi:hypothetical protein
MCVHWVSAEAPAHFAQVWCRSERRHAPVLVGQPFCRVRRVRSGASSSACRLTSRVTAMPSLSKACLHTWATSCFVRPDSSVCYRYPLKMQPDRDLIALWGAPVCWVSIPSAVLAQRCTGRRALGSRRVRSLPYAVIRSLTLHRQAERALRRARSLYLLLHRSTAEWCAALAFSLVQVQDMSSRTVIGGVSSVPCAQALF